MKFLDLKGLNHFWTKIKASFGIAIINSSECEYNGSSIIIPFVTNHQFINADRETNNDVYNWFKKASKGGTLEIVFTKREGCSVSCRNNNTSYMHKMQLSRSNGPFLATINKLDMQFSNYARLIKIDDNTLLVAEFVENKYITSS